MIRIKGFLETSFVDWPGRICAVLFLPYCNFRCPYCHNHDLVLEPEQYEDVPLEFVLERLGELSGWVDGVCITGGEPTIHPDLPSLIREIKKRGMAVKLDTNGSHPDVLRRLMDEGLLDYVAMDVKAPLEEVSYRRAVGVAVNLQRIKESIALLMEGRVEYQFRITVVPSLHKEGDLRRLAHQLAGARDLTLQNFNPRDPLDPSFREVRPYDEEWMKKMQREVSRILRDVEVEKVKELPISALLKQAQTG